MSLIHFFLGGISATIFLLLISFLDAHLLGDKFIGNAYKIKRLTKIEKFKVYLFYGCFEFSFFLIGFFVGTTFKSMIS